MATLEELERAFIAADDAGNTEDASMFADEIRRVRSAQGQTQTTSRDISIDKPTMTDKVALQADKILTEMGSVVPDFLPSRQNIVDVAAGMSEMGGLLRDSPRLKNAATESDWRTAGRIADPIAALVGLKGFQVAQQAPKVLSKVGLQKAADFLTKTPFRESILGGAGAGAATGALQGDPVEGAAMGAAMGAALRPLEVVGSKLHEVLANVKAGSEGQVVRYLNDIFPNNKDAVKGALNQLRPIVSGERPTTGLGSVSGKTKIPGLKALEQQARGRSPQLFTDVDEANALARITPLNEMAYPGQKSFDPEVGRVTLSPAEDFRKRATDPLYATANPKQVEIPPQLMSTLEGAQVSPLAIKGARSAGQSAANVGGVPSRGAAVVPKGPDALGMIPDTPFMPKQETYSIAELQRVKDELGKRISDLSRSTDNPSVTMRNNLIAARKNLIEQMTKQSGDYALANTMYRNLSAQQNQADVAKVLRDSLQSPTGSERLSSYLTALGKAPQTIKKAGGDPRFQDLREVMTPDQMRDINAIGRSVKREADYSALPASRESLPEMKSTYSTLEEATPALLRAAFAAVRKGLSVKGKATTTEAANILDRASADPQFMKQLLDQALPKDRSRIAKAIGEYVNQTRGATIGVAARDLDSQEDEE